MSLVQRSASRYVRRQWVGLILATILAFLSVGVVTACVDAPAKDARRKTSPSLYAVESTPIISPAPAKQSPAKAASQSPAKPATKPLAKPLAVAKVVTNSVQEIKVDDRAKLPTFNGRPVRPVKSMKMLTTAYSPDWRSCGASADGITASGYSVETNGGFMVAADTRVLPFHALVSIPGYNGGKPVPVLDRGGKIKGQHLDVLYPTHEQAVKWGAKHLEVTVWEYAD